MPVTHCLIKEINNILKNKLMHSSNNKKESDKKKLSIIIQET